MSTPSCDQYSERRRVGSRPPERRGPAQAAPASRVGSCPRGDTEPREPPDALTERRSRMRGLVVGGAAVAVLAMPAPAAIAVSPAQPINRVPPTVSGSTQLGDTLTASPGEWSGDAPMKFSYGWFRSTDGDFLPIPGAHGPTYTITKDDATSSRGRKVLLTVEVTATNAVAYGFATPTSNVTVQARPVRPRNRILALVDARFVGGRASTIPQLLAHNGYRTSYWALQRGRIDVLWALEDPLDNPDVKRLATGHAVVRHRGTVPFKIRLTAWGRRQL